MRILVVGDPYLGHVCVRPRAARARRQARDRVSPDRRGPAVRGRDRSERAIHEYVGSPQSIIEHMGGIEVLVVHGAPVTDAVLDASPNLRLVCCARGGPVNVDIGAASDRRNPGHHHTGQECRGRRRADHRVPDHAGARLPEGAAIPGKGGQLGSTFEGAQFFGRELAGRTLGLVGFGHVGRAVSRRARAFGMHRRELRPLRRSRAG